MNQRMRAYVLLPVLFGFIWNGLKVSGNELTTEGCGSTSTCFYGKSCKSNIDCDYFIKFTYNAVSKSVSFAIGGKHDWVAFGLRDEKKLSMNGNIGEACTKDGSIARILSFSTVRKSPNFKSQVGLFNITTSVVNGSAVCRYSRTVVTPSGTNLRDLAANWYLTSAYGRMAGSSPRKHPYGHYATSSNRVKFTKITMVSSSEDSEWDTLLLVHAITGTLAWLAFSFIGIFIARYMRDAFWGKKLGGNDLWFQLHRICMVLTTLTSLVCIVTIMVKLKGWNADFAGSHAYTGIVTHVLAVVQVIGGNLRPKPANNWRWIFNIVHRTCGVVALILAGVTMLLGLELVNITVVPVIVWFVFGFVVALGLEIYLRFSSHRSQPKTENVDMDGSDSSQPLKVEIPNKNAEILRICFGLVIVGVLSISISVFSLLGRNGHDHAH